MMTRTHIVAFLVALAVSAFLTPVVRRAAYRFGWLDDPTEARKVHRHPIPRLGGLAMAFGFWAPLAALFLYDNEISQALFAEPTKVMGFLFGSLAILAVGVWDDINGLRARYKLGWQILVSIWMISTGFVIDRINIPMLGMQVLEPELAYLVTCFWFVGIMNAINLIDGLDGLAGGVAFFAVATLLTVTLLDAEVNLLTTLFCSALAGAVIGFLFYNFNPATIFMGDGGSLFLGFVISAVGVHTQSKSNTALALTVCVLSLGLPIIDTLLSIVRRISRGKDPFSADREHIHHRLLALGLTPRQVALVLYAFCAFLGLFAVSLKVEADNDSRHLLILLALGIAVLALSHIFRFRELIHQRRNALVLEDELALPVDARVSIRQFAKGIRHAQDLDTAWRGLEGAGELLQIRDIRLEVFSLEKGEGMEVGQRTFHRDEPELSRLPKAQLKIPLLTSGGIRGDVKWTFRTAQGEEDSERRFLIMLVTEALAEYLEGDDMERVDSSEVSQG